MTSITKCSICGKEFEGPSFNAWPVAKDRCCGECYDDKVIRAKYEEMRNMRRANNRRNEEIENKPLNLPQKK